AVGQSPAGSPEDFEATLRKVILPILDLDEVPFEGALHLLERASAQGTKDGKPIPIRIDEKAFETPEGMSLDTLKKRTITLKLSNVPLIEALRYTTELADVHFRTQDGTVWIQALPSHPYDLYTQVFNVPPTFGQSSPTADPLATDARSDPKPHPTTQSILEAVGVAFPPGATAIYNPATSQIIIRNLQSELDLVEAYVDSLQANIDQQMLVTMKLIKLPSESAKEWLNGNPTHPARLEGVYTEPQFRVVLRAIHQLKDAEQQSLPSVVARSGQSIHVKSPNLPDLLKMDPVTGGDGYTIDVTVSFSDEETPRAKKDPILVEECNGIWRIEPRVTSVTLWDGQTVALTLGKHPKETDMVQTLFVTFRMLDPAGTPIHEHPPNSAVKASP
ncbi:MAG: hypothetical protein AAGJ31_02930, partial [Verrucomicrobiota bacterium]